MATPVIRKLRAGFPEAKLHFLTSLQAEFVVRHNPLLDRIYVYKKYRKMTRPIQRFFFRQCLRRENYDACLVLELQEEYLRFAHRLKTCRMRLIGFDGHADSRLLDQKRVYDYETHVIKNHLTLVRDFLKIPFGPDDLAMEFHFPKRALETFGQKFSREFGEVGLYFVMHPGCTEARPYRGINPDILPDVLDFLLENDITVFLTGRLKERRQMEMIQAKSRSPQRVFLFLERDFYDLAALIRHAGGVISPDTGIMHIAQALNVPVLALFGPTNPAHTGLTGNGCYRLLRKAFACGPCNHLSRNEAWAKLDCLNGAITPCMKAFSDREVIEALEEILKKRPRSLNG